MTGSAWRHPSGSQTSAGSRANPGGYGERERDLDV